LLSPRVLHKILDAFVGSERRPRVCGADNWGDPAGVSTEQRSAVEMDQQSTVSEHGALRP
jgi:hypothetical protein